MSSVEQIVALRYNDMKALKKELDRLFPGQKWEVDVSGTPSTVEETCVRVVADGCAHRPRWANTT
jgi:hypothetical protein